MSDEGADHPGGPAPDDPPEAREPSEPSEQAAVEVEAPPTPARRRKRRKRRDAGAKPSVTETSAEEEAEVVDDGLPSFAAAWPRDPALDALVAAFEAGDYARVRREAPALARQTEDDAVRRAARELRRRLDPDPAAVYMLVAAGALLAFFAGWYWLHPHFP